MSAQSPDQPDQNEPRPMNTIADVKAYLEETVAENRRLREKLRLTEEARQAALGVIDTYYAKPGAPETVAALVRHGKALSAEHLPSPAGGHKAVSEPRFFYHRSNIPELIQEAMEDLREIFEELKPRERRERLRVASKPAPAKPARQLQPLPDAGHRFPLRAGHFLRV